MISIVWIVMSLNSDNKKFWRQVKPFFSDKTPPNSKIILIDDNEIISHPVKCAEVMNNFFINAAINLDIDNCIPRMLLILQIRPCKLLRNINSIPALLKYKNKALYKPHAMLVLHPY